MSLILHHAVSHDDVGGEAKYEAITVEFNEFYRSVPMICGYQKCYCQNILTRYRKKEGSKWTCQICFRYQTGRIYFVCEATPCLWRQTTGNWFCICAVCAMDKSIGDQDDEKENGLICSKFRSHMNVIS